MLRHRWLIAGGGKFPFTDDAVAALYAHSHGIPRTQVILADNALLAAFIQGEKSITPALIEQVVADRGLPDTDPVAPPRVIKRGGGTVKSVRRASA
jgi:hypothetical protein